MMSRAPLFYAMFFVMTASAGCAGNTPAPGDRNVHREGKYFSVGLPEGWSVQPHGLGLSQDEKKVYGVTLSAPLDPAAGEGSSPRISAHYFAPDNLVDKTPEKYIKVHSFPRQEGEPFPALPRTAGGKVGGREANIFGNITHERGPDRTMNAERTVIWESFAVIPVKKGYYALRYSAPAGQYEAHLPAFEAFIASFKPLLK